VSYYTTGYTGGNSASSTFIGARTFQVEDALNSSVTTIVTLSHITTGTAAAGIGARLLFTTEDGGGSEQNTGAVVALLTDVTAGAEVGALDFYGVTGGSLRAISRFGTAEVVFNDDGNDQDFRIESPDSSSLFFVDAGNDVVCIGTGTAVVDSKLTMGGPIAASNGVVTFPGLTFASDTDMGFYRVAADQLGLALAGAQAYLWTATAQTITQAVATSGSPVALTLTGGAHTTLAASTEAIDANFNLARTVQFATGALTTQRAFVIQGPTYGFVGASTLTNATTFDITSAPTAGTNATFTNSRVMRLGGAVTIGATSASMTYSVVDIPAHTVTVTGTTQVTSASMAAGVRIGAITLTDSSAVTIDAAASLYIAGPPVQAGSVTLSSAYSLWVDSGNIRGDGILFVGGATAQTDSEAIAVIATANKAIINGLTPLSAGQFSDAITWGSAYSANNLGILRFRQHATASAIRLFHAGVSDPSTVTAGTAAGGLSVMLSQVGVGVIPNTAVDFDVLQTTAASGIPTAIQVVGAAHTNLTASSEAVSANFNFNQTVQFATGALTTQRTFVIQAGTYAFAGASTLTNATAFDITAAPAAGTNATFTNTRIMRLGGAVTIGATSAGMTYSGIDIPAHTITVTGSTQVTSAAMAAGIRIGAITLTDASAVTIDAAASLYIAGPPVQAGSVTLTAAYSLWLDSGIARFDGSILVGGTAIETGSTNTVNIFNGTAPDNGVADTVIIYSTDNTAGNTIPSFYCEGTGVLATGQADSASSVRVLMRINGTVVTLLAI